MTKAMSGSYHLKYETVPGVNLFKFSCQNQSINLTVTHQIQNFFKGWNLFFFRDENYLDKLLIMKEKLAYEVTNGVNDKTYIVQLIGEA